MNNAANTSHIHEVGRAQHSPDRRVVSHVLLRDAAAPVYAGGTEAAALARAAREIPAFRERAELVRTQRATGYPDTIPEGQVDEFLADLIAEKQVQRRQGRAGGPAARGESGNVRVRMPPKLHRELVAQAQQQGVSLNTLVVTYLAREAGYSAAGGGQAK